jgi:methylation protein EvaC
MRYYLTKSNNVERSKNLKKQLEKEERLGLLSMESYIEFSNKCEKSRKGFKDRLTKLKLDNKKIIGYGATSKSTTILNYCNVGNDLIDFIVDTTPTKHNTFTPGKHIPVLPYENFLPHPDVSVLFAWNHKKEILEKESDYKGHWMTHLYEEYI